MSLIKYYKLIACWVLIAILCFTPGDEFKEVKINIPYFDKLIHFLMFYGLGLLIRAIEYKEIKSFYLIIVISVLYAGIIEIIQANYIPVRSGDFFDFLSDLTGLLIALITYKYYPVIIKKLLR